MAFKHSITFKMALICALVVLVFLTISNVIFTRLESRLIHEIIDSNETETQRSIEEEARVQQAALNVRLAANAEICAAVSAAFLFNFNEQPLVYTLRPYMNLDDIVAIQVVDQKDSPFFAYWKEPQVQSGTGFPDGLDLKGTLTAEKDSIYEGEKVGKVVVFMTDKFLLQRLAANKKNAQKKLLDFKQDVDGKLNRVVITQSALSLIVILALITAVILSLKWIAVNPIKGIIARVKDMAEGEGDLTLRLDETAKDELGELARWLNMFIGNLQKMIRFIANNSDSLTQASKQLTDLSGQMAGGAGAMSDKSDAVAAATTEMTANIETVAKSMDDVNTNINMIATAAEEMTSTIEEIAKNSGSASNVTSDAVSRAQGTSEKVDELGQAAMQIGKVTEVITEISEQTNLLALNATIEAARAGEAGKGFAVVANEIKSLATQTAGATREIKENIERMQQSTSGTVTEISEILTTINQVNDIVTAIAGSVEEQLATTKEIANNVNRASAGIDEINDSMSQSSNVSADIARDINDVSQEAETVSSNSSHMEQSAKNLDQLAEDLKKLVNQFKV